MKTILTILLLAWATPSAWSQGAFLGVELSADLETSGGARIAQVQSPSAASLMGLQADDLITGVDDLRIESAQDLVQAMAQRLPGEIVTVHVMRGAETMELPGVLGRRPGDTRAAPGVPPTDSAPWVIEPLNLDDWLPNTPWQLEQPLQWKMPDLWYPGPIWDGERPNWIGPKWSEQFEPYLQPQIDWNSLDPFPSLKLEGATHSVQIRYPESTPESDRKRLIEEAREKYGPEVEVKFEGRGTSISIQSSIEGSREFAPRDLVIPRVKGEDDEI